MKLSFCMIVRNEAACVERCLDSITAIADEIIVVDTGSTDETVVLAEMRGATVVGFPWCDDFAAAYNAALDQVTGDWILCLDADEWLLPESQPLVRELIQNPQALAYFVQRQEVKREGQKSGFIEMRHLRLGRNIPAIRLIGRDHPSFGGKMEEYAKQKGLQILDSPLRIRHTGYLPQNMPAKLDRAARLLQLELAERPGRIYYEIELAFTWDQLKDPRGRVLLESTLVRVLAHAHSPNPPSMLASRVLEWCLRTYDIQSIQVRQALRLAERWYPLAPPLLDAAAQVYYTRNDFARAIPLLKRLVQMSETGLYDRSISFSEHILGDKPYLNLAVCYHRLAQYPAAEHWYQRLLVRFPRHPAALEALRSFTH